MYRLEKEFRFEAAHRLPSHDGKCQRLHGHSFKGVLILEARHLRGEGPKTGMVIDFSDVKTALAPLLEDKLDHHYLNETLALAHPTSENVARYIYDTLKPVLPILVGVRIKETCTSAATYLAQMGGLSV
jgi:6-pyruvoyltetrahydropterin/6-carboxytetrahydropterin synthase